MPLQKGGAMEELKDRIRKLIVEKLRLENVKPEEIQDEMPLFGEGLGLDSIDALELVVALEKEFGIKITDEEVGVKVFQNLNALAAFIQEKGQAAP
jgi:acyl carrier protein